MNTCSMYFTLDHFEGRLLLHTHTQSFTQIGHYIVHKPGLQQKNVCPDDATAN